jgi:WD40 repeat protein/serine/threonine protein kinase
MASSGSSQYELLDQLAEEFAERYRRGEHPSLQEYVARYPQLADGIRDLFPALVKVEQVQKDHVAPPEQPPAYPAAPLQQVGDYRILAEIGRGGMGVVYEAEQQALGRRVALKVLLRTTAGDGSAQIRFQREAKAAARLHHTNIVPVFDVGQDGEHLYYAMQLIHGQGLDGVIHDLKRLRGHAQANPAPAEKSIAASLMLGRFQQEKLADPNDPHATDAYEGSPPSSAVLPGQSELSSVESNRRAYYRSVAQIGVLTASALSYAHARGIVHRDIKPGNLLLDTTGNVWVTDFGLAKTGDAGMTHSGDILGTIRYMSPERFRGQCDVRADVYALGMTLYELMTLKAAYVSGDRLKLVELIRNSEPASPRSIDAQIPRDLETIVMKSLDRDVRRRYQSADELWEDLQRFVNDEPIKARRIGSVERLGLWCRRNKGIAALTATVAVLLLAGTILSLLAAGYFRRLASDETAARNEAEAARQDALVSAEQASIAGQKEAQRRTEAERAKEQLRRQLYVSDMNLARQLWDDGAIDRLEEVLDSHRPSAGQSDLRGFEWYYWWRAAHLEAATVHVSSNYDQWLQKLAVSPDGRIVAVADSDRRIFLFDSVAEKPVRQILIRLNRGGIAPVAFARDGALLVVAGPDHILRRWEIRTWTPLPELTAHPKGRGVAALAVSPSGPVMASADNQGEIVLWDTDTWKPVATLPARGEVTSLAFAPDGKTLVAAMKSGQLDRVSGWASPQAVKRELVATIKLPHQTPYQAEITSVAYGPDGSLLATGGNDGRVRLWNATTWQQVHAFEAPASVQCVAFSSDGKLLAAGTEKTNAVYVWGVSGRTLQTTIKGHFRKVRSIAFAGNRSRLWSASWDGQVKVWDLARCQPDETVSLPISPSSLIAFGSDGRSLFIHGADGIIWQWALAGQAPPAPWNKGEQVAELAFSADRTVLIGRSPSDQKLRLWDLAGGNPRREWTLTSGLSKQSDSSLYAWLRFVSQCQLLAISGDGRTVAWAQQEGDTGLVIVVLNVATGQQTRVDLRNQPGIPPWVRFLALSPDGKRMVSNHGVALLWDLSAPQSAPIPTVVSGGLWWDIVAFTPDGKEMAVGFGQSDIAIVDAQTGARKQTLRGHAGWVTCLAFTSDGRTLVSGSEDGTVRLWDPKTGELRTTFTGHGGLVASIAISPDGAAIASCSLDQTVRVWRAATQADVNQKRAATQADVNQNPEYVQTFERQGDAQIRAGNWKQAAADLSQALDVLPPGTPNWHERAYRLAFVLVYLGEVEKYQALCRRTVRDFQRTANVQIAERTSTMCLFAGSAQDSEVREHGGQFADFAVANIDGAIARKEVGESLLAYVQHAKGIAEYRRGNYAAALEWFQKSVPALGALTHPAAVACQATDLLFSAMAAYQLGKTQEARHWLAEADRLSGTLSKTFNHTDRQMMDLVRREAEALLAGKKQ